MAYEWAMRLPHQLFRCGLLQRRGLVTATSPKPIRRFYQDAWADQQGDTWRVVLDGKPVKTPKGTMLHLPTRLLAEQVAAEWKMQGEQLRPKEMRLTTIGCTALDLVQPECSACVDRMLPYLAMDTICFEDDHELLAERQAAEWGPLRRWFEERYNVSLGEVARGLDAPQHPEATLLAVREALRERDEWELCALEIATSTAKSLIVATALLDREGVSAHAALKWALLEEHFQIERWGLVEGEHDISHSDLLNWLEATQRFGKRQRI